MISTTICLNEEDVRALRRARAAGHSASEVVRITLHSNAFASFPVRPVDAL
jgi:hypothetical protein